MAMELFTGSAPGPPTAARGVIFLHGGSNATENPRCLQGGMSLIRIICGFYVFTTLVRASLTSY